MGLDLNNEKKSRLFLVVPIICSLIIFILLGGGAYLSINATPKSSVDIARINEVTKSIESKLNSAELEGYLIKENVSLVRLDDSDYQATVYGAIKNNFTITDVINDGEIIGKAIFSSNKDEIQILKARMSKILLLASISLALIMSISFAIFYYSAIKPFIIMQKFASNVARGDLDIPIHMFRKNYFGAFTESFDLMRDELKKAKEAEYKANTSKKELVASLSHDIKTPVATIKALCEILEIKLANTVENEKIKIIENKANVIDSLISNMLSSTMDDLEMLKVNKGEENSLIISEMIREMNYYNLIEEESPIPECLIYCDKLRLEQVIDNIINNSYKYANTKVYVKYKLEEEVLSIAIRDSGDGVSDEELPLIFEKYYRCEESKNKSGSGLGLYLSKQFMDGMGGSIEAYFENGFVINIKLKLV